MGTTVVWLKTSHRTFTMLFVKCLSSKFYFTGSYIRHLIDFCNHNGISTVVTLILEKQCVQLSTCQRVIIPSIHNSKVELNIVPVDNITTQVLWVPLKNYKCSLSSNINTTKTRVLKSATVKITLQIALLSQYGVELYQHRLPQHSTSYS